MDDSMMHIAPRTWSPKLRHRARLEIRKCTTGPAQRLLSWRAKGFECFEEEQRTALYTAEHCHTLHNLEGKHCTNIVIVTSRGTQQGKR